MPKRGTFVFERSGFTLTRCGKKGGQIISAEHGRVEIKLGQRVYSNGRFLVPAGTLGLVIGINLPFEEGKTTDILDVFFEGANTSYKIKFKDVQPPIPVESA